MVRFIVALFAGASLGGTYALIGLGLVLAFRATETFNFAHGQLMLLPAFLVAYFQANQSMVFGLGLVVSLGIVAMVGVLFYVLVLQRTTGLPIFMGVIATMGLASILDGAMTLMFGSATYGIDFPGLPSGVVTIAGARISKTSLTLTVFTIVLAAIVAAVLRFTHLGTRIRAAGQDPVLASQGGIHVRRLYMGSWAIAAILAGVAGIAYGSTTLVGPDVASLGLLALPAILLGGLDSIEGAVVGGMIIGIMQGFVLTYLGGEYVEVLTWAVLLVLLLTRPRGLFGTESVTRV